MQRTQQLAIVGGIAAIGVIGALPFVRPAEPGTTPAVVPDTHVTLARELPPRLELSPAQGLHDDEPSPEASTFAIPAIGRSRLENHGLPPDLPEQYQPLNAPLGPPADLPALPAAPVSERQAELSLDEPRLRIHTEPAESNAAPAQKPERTHRIVDGDTLARLAKRYWNDESLATELFAANQAVLRSPDPLPLGVVLRIPAKPAATAGQPHVNEAREELPAPVRQPKLDASDELPLAPIPSGAFSSPGA